MKFMVGVGVFCKQDMIGWLLDGITTGFPRGTKVVFFFEACTDASLPNFLALAPEKLDGYDWSWKESKEHILEHGVHCRLIDDFMLSDCDALIVPHDDNRFVDPGICGDIERVFAHYGDTLGWVGGRDGHEQWYQQMISSPFSCSDVAREKLPVGQWVERSMLNTGPMVYSRALINKIGKPGDGFEGWYWWTDYSLRARASGLKNVLLSMDCLHTKFGQLKDNKELYSGDLVARDLKRLCDKWKPVLGTDPV